MTVTKREFVSRLQQNHPEVFASKTNAEDSLNAVLDEIRSVLTESQELRLVRYFTFGLRSIPAHKAKCYNFKTQKTTEVNRPAETRPHVTLSRAFRAGITKALASKAKAKAKAKR